MGVWGKWIKHAKYIYNIQDFNPEQVLLTIAIVYAVILKIGVKIIGKVPHLSTALFGVKN